MLVDVYDTRTGRKLPYRVRDVAVDHPVLGAHLSRTPRQRAASATPEPPRTPRRKASAPTPPAPTTTPDAGDRKD